MRISRAKSLSHKRFCKLRDKTTQAVDKYCHIGSPDSFCRFCGAKMFIRERIGNSTIKKPLFNICCRHGQVLLAPVQVPPQALRDLLDEKFPHKDGSFFKTRIRHYNSRLALVSIEVREEKLLKRGVQVFRMGGECYHRVGSLLPVNVPADNDAKAQTDAHPVRAQPRFMQLYFYDGANEVANRVQGTSMDTEQGRRIMKMLQDMLKNSPTGFYSRIEPNIERMRDAATPGYKLVLRAPEALVQSHSGAYNLPSVP